MVKEVHKNILMAEIVSGCGDPVRHEKVLPRLLAENGTSYRKTSICSSQLGQGSGNKYGWLN